MKIQDSPFLCVIMKPPVFIPTRNFQTDQGRAGQGWGRADTEPTRHIPFPKKAGFSSTSPAHAPTCLPTS